MPPRTADDPNVKRTAESFWYWLGSPRGIDPIYWRKCIADMYARSEMDWLEFGKFLQWVAQENEFTVENLRLARNPMRSLHEKQFHNCLVFWSARQAKLRARERKSWKYGPCRTCDKAAAEKPANPNYDHYGLCTACETRWWECSTAVKTVRPFIRVLTYPDGHMVWYLAPGPDFEYADAVAGGITTSADIEDVITAVRLDDPQILRAIKKFIFDNNLPQPENSVGLNMDFEAENV